MTPISTHFTLEELTFSEAALRLGIDNTPNDTVVTALTALANGLLEPVRALLEVPLRINSGYRSPAVNAQVGGATNSAHMSGNAADCVPEGLDLHTAFVAIKSSGLPFDQLIIECNAWLHIAQAAPGVVPRRQCLVASGTPGHWTYAPG